MVDRALPVNLKALPRHKHVIPGMVNRAAARSQHFLRSPRSVIRVSYVSYDPTKAADEPSIDSGHGGESPHTTSASTHFAGACEKRVVEQVGREAEAWLRQHGADLVEALWRARRTAGAMGHMGDAW